MEQSPIWANIAPAWAELLDADQPSGTTLRTLAETALAEASAQQGGQQPPPELVFEFLRYSGPDAVVAVVVGQDPYPNGAMGLSSSSVTKSTKLPATLVAVFRNLVDHKLAVEVKGRGGDLRPWATQGVLLLNAALTTQTGKRGAHRQIWRKFTTGLITALAARAATHDRRLVFMLWGNDAKRVAPHVGGHHVLEWSHPSPLSNNRHPPARRFEAAPHFAETNEMLRAAGRRPICWDTYAPTTAYTDGACTRNGHPDAKASFGVWIRDGPAGGVKAWGVVPALTIELVDAADPRQGFRTTAQPAVPTNNRGEYLAWCWVLLALLRSRTRGAVEVVSDCRLFIMTMTTWLPARRTKGTAAELKNYDLVSVGDALLTALREQAQSVTLTHTRSHRRQPPATAPERERQIWGGNDTVDRLATACLVPGPSASAAALAPVVVDADPAQMWPLFQDDAVLA